MRNHVPTLVWLILKATFSDNGRAIKSISFFPKCSGQLVFFYLWTHQRHAIQFAKVTFISIEISKALHLAELKRLRLFFNVIYMTIIFSLI